MILEQWLLTTTQPEQVGKLYTVGLNNIGQLGNNSVTFGNSFTQIGTLSWKSISVGASHTVAIRSDGLLYTWGSNLYGSIGANDTLRDNNRSSPVQIGSSSWSLVDAKGFHTVALTADNRLFTWGLNSSGQLGDGTTNNTDKLLSYSILSSYSNAKFVLDYSNRLWAWARGSHDGAPGVGVPSATAITSPTQVPGSWSNVWAAPYTGFFVATNNSLWASGSNFGRFGNNTTTSTSVPTQISANNEWSFITGSFTGSILAIKPNGTLWAWGANTNVLGVDPIPSGSRSSPVQLGTASWTMVSVGASHAMGVQTDGSLWAWGTNTYGQLGNNANTNVLTPVKIGTSSWITVAAGQDYTLGITSSNTLFGWGRNISGHFAVGDGTSIDRSSPVVVGGAAANTSFTYVWASKAAAGANMAAIAANGAIWRWGNRDSFQNLAGGGDLSVPSIISGTNATHIISGGGVSLFRSNTGTVSTYGLGDGLLREDLVSASTGVFLLGQASFRISPVQVGISSWAQVSAGFSHTLGIRSDGTLWAWGGNRAGQLGDKTGWAWVATSVQNRSSPVQIGSDTWKDISAGLTHSVGITANNELYGWGNTLNYATGVPYSWISVRSPRGNYLRSDGTIHTSGSAPYSPVQVPGSNTNSWKQFIVGNNIASGYWAINANNNLFAWGYNAAGAPAGILGFGNQLNVDFPTQLGSNTWSTVVAGRSHVAAIRSDGGLFTWGSNDQGQLGANNIVSTSSPTKIGSSSWSVISVGSQLTMGITSAGALFGWGNNGGGQLGNDTANTKYSSPVQIGSSSWSQVSTSGGHTLAIDALGRLFTWGNNGNGQLGFNDTILRSSPVQLGNASWTSVFTSADGLTGSWAIRHSDKALFAWGINTTGSLGDGTATSRSSPVQIGVDSWKLIDSRDYRTYGITQSDEIFIWGDNASGQIPTGVTGGSVPSPFAWQTVTEPFKIANGTWNQVSAGSAHSVALDSNNYLYGWGHPAVAVPVGYASWAMVAASGGFNTFFIRSDGKLFVSGSATVAVPASPSVVIQQRGADTWSWIDASGGVEGTFYGIKTNGTMWLGSAAGATTQVNPDSDWAKVWTRANVNIAIKANGSLYTWHPTANNFYGQFGHNTQNTIVTTPTKVGTSSWVFAAGYDGSTVLAMTIDGTLWSWGRNNSGQLGDGTIIDRSSPVQVAGSWANTGNMLGIINVNNTSLAIRNDKTLWAWGAASSFGILTVTTSTPVQINSSSWSFLTTTYYNPGYLAIDIQGRLYGAGRNAEGQLGIGTSLTPSSPTEVVGGGSWIFAQAQGQRYGLGIKTDGSLHYIGGGNFINSLNELLYGYATTINKSSPVQIGLGTEHLKSPTQLGSSQWKKISAGQNYTLGVQSNNILYAWGPAYGQIIGKEAITTPTPIGYYATSATAGISHAAALVTGNTN